MSPANSSSAAQFSAGYAEGSALEADDDICSANLCLEEQDSWTVQFCVIGSSRKETIVCSQLTTVTALKQLICSHLVHSSSGRFLYLHPDYTEFSLHAEGGSILLNEPWELTEVQHMPDGLLTVLPMVSSPDSAWRPICSSLNDRNSGLELRAIELGGSNGSNCFFYSFVAALEEYTRKEDRPAFIRHVSNLVAETQERLAQIPEFPEENLTLEALKESRTQNEALDVVSECFDGAISVWNLRDLVAHRLPDFLRPSFFREGANNPEENFCRWGLHAPVMPNLTSSTNWFHWRMRFAWGVYPDAAKLLADLLQIPISLYENRASQGKQYCICTLTRVGGVDLKEASNDPRFGSGLQLLGMSGHWQLAQVREQT